MSEEKKIKKPKKENFTFLTEEQIEEIANREWKKPTIFTNDERLAKRIKNLTGPKTVEGKKKVLRNLRPATEGSMMTKNIKHGGYVHALLTEEEREFYEERKQKYIKDFELNESSDEALLRTVLMEEVIWYRLMKRKTEKPSLNLDKPLNDCMRRLREALKALGMTREQRQGFNVNIRASVADLVDRVEKEILADQERIKQLDAEEEAMIREKRRREQAMTIEGDYAILDEIYEQAQRVEAERFGTVEDEEESED